jgi:osmoprotectant transport system ATP-binding protein
MFELHSVTKRYGGVPALNDVDLVVPSGQTTVLVGPSGCGKTTLLKLLVRLLTPDAGTVKFDGEALTGANVLLLRRRMGYVIQEGGLFPHLSARRNVTLMAEYLGWKPEPVAARMDALAALVRLPAELLARYPAQLSGGQRQRVALMRALMLDPEALLLDEPLGALDPMIRYELQEELRDIFRRLRKTVVLVTHDMAEAAFFGDRIALLRDGRIVQLGTVEDFTQRPADPFVTRFLRAQRVAFPPSPSSDS